MKLNENSRTFPSDLLSVLSFTAEKHARIDLSSRDRWPLDPSTLCTPTYSLVDRDIDLSLEDGNSEWEVA